LSVCPGHFQLSLAADTPEAYDVTLELVTAIGMSSAALLAVWQMQSAGLCQQGIHDLYAAKLPGDQT
jgi:hypothetical protein